MGWIKVLNNREWAVMVWAVVFIIWMASLKSTRKGLASLVVTFIKTLTSRQVGPLFFAYMVYVLAALIIFENIRVWDTGLIKDTVIWFFGTAFILFMNASSAGSDSSFFKKIVNKNVKFTIIFIFIVNHFVFNFFVELALVFLLTLLVLLSTVADMKKEFKQIRTPLNVILVLIILIIIGHAFTELINNYRKFGTLENLRDLILGPLMTFTVLPFIYLLGVYSVYELLFLQVRLRMRDDKTLARYTKLKIFLACGPRLRRIYVFNNEYYQRIGQLKNRREVNQLIEDFATSYRDSSIKAS